VVCLRYIILGGGKTFLAGKIAADTSPSDLSPNPFFPDDHRHCRRWRWHQTSDAQRRSIHQPKHISTMNRSFISYLALSSLLLSPQSIAAYNSNAALSRRDLMQGLVAAGAAASFAAPKEANAVISSKFCAYGTGDGCEDLAEGNEYIRQLQERSAENKETIQQVRKTMAPVSAI
jgi:hypothetical protein